MEKNDSNMIYIVITRIGHTYNKITVGKVLRQRGYERIGNGYYFLRVMNNHYAEQIITHEAKWLWKNGMAGIRVNTLKKCKSRYSPYKGGR
jgi:hypothetical protein